MKAFTSNTTPGRVPYFEGYTFLGIGQPADGEYYLSKLGSLYKYVYMENPIYYTKNGICYSRDLPCSTSHEKIEVELPETTYSQY